MNVSDQPAPFARVVIIDRQPVRALELELLLTSTLGDRARVSTFERLEDALQAEAEGFDLVLIDDNTASRSAIAQHFGNNERAIVAWVSDAPPRGGEALTWLIRPVGRADLTELFYRLKFP